MHKCTATKYVRRLEARWRFRCAAFGTENDCAKNACEFMLCAMREQHRFVLERGESHGVTESGRERTIERRAKDVRIFPLRNVLSSALSPVRCLLSFGYRSDSIYAARNFHRNPITSPTPARSKAV